MMKNVVKKQDEARCRISDNETGYDEKVSANIAYGGAGAV
jgi:hypothetical protein